PRSRLVEPETTRLRRERAGDLESTLIAIRRIARGLVGLPAQRHEREQLTHPLASPALFAPDARRSEHGAGHARVEAAVLADEDVLQHRHLRKQADRLE